MKQKLETRYGKRLVNYGCGIRLPLVVEFGLRQIPVSQQPDFPVTYKSVIVGSYVPDLICFGLVVVDAKTIEEITDYEIGKMLNYLKVTNLQVGLLINFKHPKLEFKRVARS